MHEFVFPLAELAESPKPRSVVGGKAHYLSRLWVAGLPVPPGLVITTAASRLDEPQQRRLFEHLRARVRDLGEFLAVRSSAVLEDDVAASAPGVFASVLHVRHDELEDAVRRVWASARTPLVLEYARARGIDGDLSVAVIVQRQVPEMTTRETSAGTLYTRVPGKPERDEMLLDVRSRGDVDAPAPGAASRVLQRLPRTPVNPPQAGSVRSDADTAPVSLDALRTLALSAEQAIDADNGADVEWVAHGHELWIVQARPIVHPKAQQGSAERSQLPPALLAFSRVRPEDVWRWDVTHNPDPLSPAQAGLVELVDESRLAPYRMRVVGGYLYVATNHELDAAAGAHTSPRRDPMPRDADDLRALFDHQLGPAMREALALPDTHAQVGGAPTLGQALDAYQRFYTIYAGRLTPLLAQVKRALPAFLRAHLDTAPAETGAPHIEGQAEISPDEPPDRQLDRQPDELAFGLAIPDQLVGVDALLEQAIHGQISRAQLMAEIGAMATAWDVACKTLCETPALVERALSEDRALARAHADARARADVLLRSVRERIPATRVHELERLVALARTARAIAEADDLLFARAQANVRRALLHVARTWNLQPLEQIFYVPLSITIACVEHGHPPDIRRLERLARAARASMERQRAWQPPLAFADGAALPVRADRDHCLAGDSWSGYGIGGRVRGRAVRVAQLSETPAHVDGAVIVAATVTPAMAVWMRGAAAMVAEHGGLLDHGAAMARELGIPCVVECAGSWSAIRTGDHLWVDGDAGLVLRRPGPPDDH